MKDERVVTIRQRFFQGILWLSILSYLGWMLPGFLLVSAREASREASRSGSFPEAFAMWLGVLVMFLIPVVVMLLLLRLVSRPAPGGQ